MGIKDVSGPGGAGPLSATDAAAEAAMLATIPVVITDDLLAAAVERGGADTYALKQELEGCRKKKRPMRDGDVDALIRRGCRHGGGEMDQNQALVMAYYAQKHRGVFAPDSFKRLSRVFSKVEWNALVIELRRFMEELRQKEEEYKKQEAIKKERLQDDLKRDERKRELIKDNGTRADRQRELRKVDAEKHEHKERLRDAAPGHIDEELTASGKLQLTQEELTKLGLMKKGFANKD